MELQRVRHELAAEHSSVCHLRKEEEKAKKKIKKNQGDVIEGDIKEILSVKRTHCCLHEDGEDPMENVRRE